MKRCPSCRRDYYDDSLLYCLDDGSALLEGPASGGEPATAILHETASPGEAATKAQIHLTEPADPPPSVVVPTGAGFDRRIILVPLVIAAIALGGFFGYQYVSQPQQIGSIAVMPFVNESGNPDSEYLSDGLAESLIYRLAQLPNLKVSPRSSVVRYKGSQADVAQLAKELEVDAVLTGRLVQRGDDLSIGLELIDARTRKLIWAEQYARKMSDLLATQREIAAAVAQKLELKLSGNEAGLTKQYTNDNEAYQLYLKGRFYWNKRTPEGTQKAIELFKAASEKDPNFALAYVGLADSYLVSTYSTRGKDNDVVPLGTAYATRALTIDPSLAEPNASLGLANTYQWNWAEAERYYKRAIEINPNYASARHWYSRLLRTLGRNDEAFDQIKLAKNLDELSVPISNNLAENLFDKGDYTGAIEEARRGIAISPHWTAYRTLANCELRLGQNDAALADAQKAVEVANGLPVALKVLGVVQAATGRRAEALATVKQIEASFAKGEIDGRDAAIVYAALGENDKVFEWLEKDFQNRNVQLIELRMEIPLIPLRGDPRFKDLLKRMNMPD
jgi:TolB-like protein/Tfp pilus assembly protein PilF